jgi:hypothetical protein
VIREGAVNHAKYFALLLWLSRERTKTGKWQSAS